MNLAYLFNAGSGASLAGAVNTLVENVTIFVFCSME